jgi:hypothetical protein
MKHLFGATCGLAIVIVAISLQSRGHELRSQVFTLTALALMGPVVVAYKSIGFAKLSFWVALLICGLLHALFIWKIYATLPLTTLGVAILLGGVEGLITLLIAAKIIDVYGDFSAR